MLGITPSMLGITPNTHTMLGNTPTMLGTTPSTGRAAPHPQGDTAAEITRPAANIPEWSLGQVRNPAAITIATNLSEP